MSDRDRKKDGRSTYEGRQSEEEHVVVGCKGEHAQEQVPRPKLSQLLRAWRTECHHWSQQNLARFHGDGHGSSAAPCLLEVNVERLLLFSFPAQGSESSSSGGGGGGGLSSDKCEGVR